MFTFALFTLFTSLVSAHVKLYYNSSQLSIRNAPAANQDGTWSTSPGERNAWIVEYTYVVGARSGVRTRRENCSTLCFAGGCGDPSKSFGANGVNKVSPGQSIVMNFNYGQGNGAHASAGE
jgi:hypothetical protein